jgi:hypothetical protein
LKNQSKKNYFSPKCYVFKDGNTLKRSHKGTPKHANLCVDQYLEALFENKIAKINFNRIAIDKKFGSATTRSITKKALNPSYLKLKVRDDLITIIPHSDKNGFL